MALFAKSRSPHAHGVALLSPRDEAQRIADEALAQADLLAGERTALTRQIEALGRREAGLADLIHRSEDSLAELTQAQIDATLLAEVGIRAATVEDDGEGAALTAQITALRTEHEAVERSLHELAGRAATLRGRESALRQQAEDAPVAALESERAGLIAEARTAWVRHLLALQKIGRWQKEAGLTDLDPAELLSARVRPVEASEVQFGSHWVQALLRPHHGADLRWLDKEITDLGIGEAG